MNKAPELPKLRLEDPTFWRDLINTIAIEFTEAFGRPEWAQQIPNPEQILTDLRAGRQIMYRSWLDSIVTSIGTSYILSDAEMQQLRKRIFKLNE